jgi:hypothetical protein
MPMKLLLEATTNSTSKKGIADTNSRVVEFVRLLRKANGEWRKARCTGASVHCAGTGYSCRFHSNRITHEAVSGGIEG